ncbi:ATPase [Comamonas testosteroni]|uniref:ATPase n=1 Tax=Comamonas testosteroni TaxID=285 RepID=A0A373F8E4_COMTE|nr:ATPase [Comamonas testosteroni]
METTMNHMDYPEALIPLAANFKIDVDPSVGLEGMAPGNPYAPTIDPEYVFAKDRFRDMLAFWMMKFRALKIIGDPAAGKTSIVEQWHARLGLPLFIVSCHENMTETDLIGQFIPQSDGTLKWSDSPVMAVYRHGGSALLDEWNNLNPNAATVLNAMLEGYTITIAQTGEVVKPHPSARFFATQNPVDGKAVVQGRYIQDTASDDRFMEMWVDYLGADLEVKVIVSTIRKIDTKSTDEAVLTQASALVKVANEVREKFKNNHLDSNQHFNKPLSTRSLKRWAQLTVAYRSVTGTAPMLYALPRAVSGLTAEMRSGIEKIVKEVLGLTT